MQFQTQVAGIPCQCKVDCLSANQGNKFELLDVQGNQAPWLSSKVTPEDDYRLMEEFNLLQTGERYGYL